MGQVQTESEALPLMDEDGLEEQLEAWEDQISPSEA